ncbi:MAG TPA: glycoside hydrolase family 18 protein [Pirellulales bacterium]|nr:glycoside hydrolase family 18 protein [Pirellulales bacterium]
MLPKRVVQVFAGITLLLVVVAPNAALPAEQPDVPPKVFVGYVYQQPQKINFSLYTHLCHAFLDADEDGKIRPSKSCPSRQLVVDAHKAGVKVIVSLGGWGWDKQFTAIVGRQESLDRFNDAVIAIVNEYDYDGVDVDWEYPDNPAKAVGFDKLCRRLRGELGSLGKKKGRRMVETMAASANPSTLKSVENSTLLDTMDWINVMTYDYAGDWSSQAGHHSPLFASSKQTGTAYSTELSMKAFVKRGIPASRLAVGLPLYGRTFAVSQPYARLNKSSRRPAVRGGSYRNIDKLINEKGWVRTWDDETKNPWAIAPDGSAVIAYDDIESLSVKTEWAMKQSFRGVFFWQISDDQMPDGHFSLQEAAHKKWEQAGR